MDLTVPPAERSPAGAALAGRRRSTTFAAQQSLPPQAGADHQKLAAAETTEPSPQRVVTFVEPPDSASLRRSAAGGPKRFGFDLPPGGDGGGTTSGGGSVVEEGGSGWEEGSTRVFTGVSRRKKEQLQQEIGDSSRQRSKYDEREVDRMGDIPDLEEAVASGDLDLAPHPTGTRHARVQPLSELQRDQPWVPAGGDGAEGIDLSLLTACLCPSGQVQDEGDDVWDADQLLMSLKSELGAAGGDAESQTDNNDDFAGI